MYIFRNNIYNKFGTKNSSRKVNSSTGFTLIELLVVIAIIGMLSAITLASLNSARAKARNTQRKSDFNAISKALTLYYDKFGTMPPNFNPGSAACSGSTYYASSMQLLIDNGFMSKIPLGPQNDYCYYNYSAGSPDGAMIVTSLENYSSMTGEPESCRNWTGSNWCRSDIASSQYCVCNKF